MKKIMVVVIVIGLLLVGKGYISHSEPKELNIYAGAGLKAPLEKIAEKYGKENNINLVYNFAGCGQHLSQMENSDECDVFIAGSNYFGDVAIEKGFIESYLPLAKHIPAIATSKDIKADDINELFSKKYILGQSDIEATALGKIAEKIYKKNGVDNYSEVVKKVVYTPTANQLLVYLDNGNIDFCVVWEDMTICNEKYNTYQIPEDKNVIKEIPIAVTKNTDMPDESQKFIEYLLSEEGIQTFEEFGFKMCN